MSQQVSDYILERLGEWGVRRIYGYPGDSINGVMGALDRAKETMDFVQVRHEEMAAFMATAHAKYTGEVGVCCASAGPGAIHLLNGLYDAKLDHQPVVALLGQVGRPTVGTEYQQETDLHALFKDVAGAYIQTLNTPDQARHLIDQAVRIARSERTVTAIILPHDVQSLPAVKSQPHAHGRTHSGISFSVPRVIPTQTDLQHAADVLNAGERVAILIGAGALDSTEPLMAVADALGAGVAKALLGLPALPETIPYCTGSIGLLGTLPSWELMQHCDTLLMVGTDFPYAEFLPKEGHARGVQIDITPRRLSSRYPMEVNLTGDCRETLTALLPLLTRKTNRAWQEKVISNVAKWQNVMHDRAEIESTPLNPHRLYRDLFKTVPDNAIFAVDTGTSTVWYALHHRFRAGMMAAVSGKLASMGAGVPYAIAAKFAYPNRPVIALVGDGAMQMNGINELITISRYWQQWDDPTLVILVLNNGDLNFVTWEMRVMEGNPTFEGSQALPAFSYAGYAQSLGLAGYKVETPEQIGPAFQQAYAAKRPAVIEAVVTADMPPLPPHITITQAKHFTEAMLKGDRNALDILVNSIKEMATLLKS